ncbi:MAG: response regulator transcription factor [Alistipes sp.]|nr:response regulator transcription factor [Alistipes sp.]
MKILVVEDEIPAQINLKKLIDKHCQDSVVVDTLSSVRSTVKWLEENPDGADVIFMDVELSDGVCFDIFDKVSVNTQIVITTAYDNYAVNAFRVNCTDYLLKPIMDSDFVRAWERCRERIEQHNSPNMEAIMDAIVKAGVSKTKEYKKRFIVKTGEKIIIIPVEDIAYCYSEDKSTYAVSFAGTRRLLDYSLDMVQEMLDPKRFFRVSRSCIVAINAIENISKHLGTRLKLQLNPRTEEDIVVSRSRTSDFLVWLDSD